VRNGDRIKLSVKDRSIHLMVDDAELKRRAAATNLAPKIPERGYSRLYAQEILGADEGCDFAFLKPR
jgi:dihydroxy-acid dehydratase